MAQPVNLKPFYLGLGALAIAGGAWIWIARADSSGSVAPTTPARTEIAMAFAGYPLGDLAAPVEVLEYSDFQCPFCAQFAILTMPDVRRRLINTGRVLWRFRDFPLPGHDKAEVAHLAAACAGEQGRFWEMHDQLYYNLGAWSRVRRVERALRDHARRAGVDVSDYDACMDERRYAARIEATKDAGVALGVNSTPTFIIGDLMFSGAVAYDSLRTLIDRATPANRP